MFKILGDPNIPTAEEVSKDVNLTGKVAIVTGANSGIGKETARVLALRNCHVILACRSVEHGKKAISEILESIGSDKADLLEAEALDLASQVSIRAFVDRFGKREKKELHFLVNNAAVQVVQRELTQDGLEISFGVNHVGPFILTILLLPFLKASIPSRIIVVSSDSHKHLKTPPDVHDYNLTKMDPFDPRAAYPISKFHNLLFAKELAKRLEGTGIVVNSGHPGLIVTGLIRGLGLSHEENEKRYQALAGNLGLPVISIQQGATTAVFLVCSEEGGRLNGRYFHGTQLGEHSPLANDEQLAKSLWDVTVQLTNVDFNGF